MLSQTLAPEFHRKIYQRFLTGFFRANSSEFGNGLGLSIALGIAKIHHGDIQVESEVGKGTTFKIFLPAQTLQ